MFEWIMVLVTLLLFGTIVAIAEYCRQLRRSKGEYEKAKRIVDDIVLSFNRELRRASEKLELVGYELEGNAAKAESALKKIGAVEKRISPIEAQMAKASKDAESTVLADTIAKVKVFEKTFETLSEQIGKLTEQVEKLSVPVEIKSEHVIPIRRDKALATLTETEMAVLETLLAEGSKTAPEIKDKVKLSREHTARVMKKLYEEGYVERETEKIPFRYSVKKEMEQLLRKEEASQS